MQEDKKQRNWRKEELTTEGQSSLLWLAFNGISPESNLAQRVIAVDSHNVLIDWCEWLISWFFSSMFHEFYTGKTQN